MLKPIFCPSKSTGGDTTIPSTTPSLSAASREASEPRASTLISVSGSMPKCSTIMRATISDGLQIRFAHQRQRCPILGTGNHFQLGTLEVSADDGTNEGRITH